MKRAEAERAARREAEKGGDAAEVAALPDVVDVQLESPEPRVEVVVPTRTRTRTRTRAQPEPEPREQPQVAVVAAEPTAFDFEWVEPSVSQIALV